MSTDSGRGGFLARVYRLTTRPVDPSADEPVCVRPGLTVPKFVLEWSRHGPAEAKGVLRRLGDHGDPQGRSVLVVGRGAADLGIEVANRGATEVIALEMAGARLDLSQARLEGGATSGRVDVRRFQGSLAELEERRFGLILAVNAFRRYGASPSSRHLETLLDEIAGRLEPDGLLAVEFIAPWKSPFGGGGDSRLPWAHLLFPESVIFEEFRRVRADSDARTFGDIGINKITVERFRRALAHSGLVPVWVARNRGERRILSVLRALARVRVLEESLTLSIHGVWRRAGSPPGP